MYLVHWPLQDNSVFSFVETFAGEAQATMAFRSSDFRSARLDLKYMSAEADRCNPMDLCTPPGFAKLDLKKKNMVDLFPIKHYHHNHTV